jgi:hypothetical protein
VTNKGGLDSNLKSWRKMNRKKKVLSVVASVLMFSFAGAGQAQAADIAVTVGDGWRVNSWNAAAPATLGDRYTLANGGGVYVEVVDCCVVGDTFQVLNNGISLGTTSAPVAGTTGGVDGDTSWANDGYSWGVFQLGSGSALISLVTRQDSLGTGDVLIRFVSTPSKAVSNATLRTGNALRLDAAGTTTEKSNVVSCTPGKYTFLNGGSTAEVSNIQSYVYTLLVNGKAVSTLSSDNFRSVASHLFPTIAGNMAGTATLEGATWDLKGMSNYSAACQVYATQSGGNIQSVTTEAHDAVALAAAAEAAANVARDKEIISTWNAANEELAKKYRDQRLVAQP